MNLWKIDGLLQDLVTYFRTNPNSIQLKRRIDEYIRRIFAVPVDRDEPV